MAMFRALDARDIECRIAQVSENGVMLLLYKDARCDMRILDETVGPERWQRKHELINGNLFCSVGIKFGDEWIWKQDVGVESYTEKEKGQASDAFKRACFNWGIGRELYTAPFIWIPANKCNIRQGNGGKWVCYDTFTVGLIAYNDFGEISGLTITDPKKNGLVVYEYGGVPAKTNRKDGMDANKLSNIMIELNRTGISKKSFLEYFHVSDFSQMTNEQYEQGMQMLTSKPNKANG